MQRFVAALGVLMLAAPAAIAQNYPDRTVRIVIPFAPGGAVDSVGRIVAARLQEKFKQPVVVENRVGAGGNVAADAVAKAAPDGHTILLTTNGHAISPSLYKKLPFDPVTDFEPVTLLVNSNLILVVSKDVEAKSLQDLLALARSKPGVLNYGSTGVGNPLHLTMEMLKSLAKVDIQMVPFRGDAPLNQALMQNVVQLAVVPLVTALPQIEAGAIKPIAITGARRSSVAPNVPTVAEQGFPGFDTRSWWAMFAPAKTAAPVVKQFRDTVADVLKEDDILKRLSTFGVEPVGSAPNELAALLKAEIAKYAAIIKEAKIPQQE
jgi:tripartite-type tricarboxylate transporter receptor subunit TctC